MPSISPQAKRACPALKTFIAPTTSALLVYPHWIHSKWLCDRLLSFATCPQDAMGHVLDVFLGLTTNTSPPCHFCLYSSCRLNSDQPWSKIDLFSPDFAFTLEPGFSKLPLADLLRFETFKLKQPAVATCHR